MATYQAIAATGQAMLGLLADAVPKPEFANAQFELYQIGNLGNPMEEGVSLYLYRVAVNGTIRNRQPITGPDGRRRKPPIPLDLHYVLSVWARSAVKQQRLLGWTIRMFEDVPILPTGLLNNYGPEPEIFQPGETVEIILESLTLADLNNLWTATKQALPLSVGYVARMVGISSELPLSEAAEVQTRDLKYGALVS
jgi:Pvc16 N-terminal domain